MVRISKDLYQFTTYNSVINLSFNQYLLVGEESMLIHTGSHEQAVSIIPGVKELLEGKALKYIFISHFEGDECGGLSYILEHYPEAQAVGSEVTARQLASFGISKNTIIKKPGDFLITADYELEFISYPSEMHLWEGLLIFEKQRSILFSSDLFLRFGEYTKPLNVDFITEINEITEQQIPNPGVKVKLQEKLLRLPIQLIATGHGPCLIGEYLL